MSRHVFKTSENVEIHIGFDRPLQRLYMTIYKNSDEPDEEMLYDDLDDPSCSTFTDHLKPVMDQLNHFKSRINEVGKGQWNVPDEMYVAVIGDSFHQRVNENTKYYG